METAVQSCNLHKTRIDFSEVRKKKQAVNIRLVQMTRKTCQKYFHGVQTASTETAPYN